MPIYRPHNDKTKTTSQTREQKQANAINKKQCRTSPRHTENYENASNGVYISMIETGRFDRDGALAETMKATPNP